MIRAVAEAIRSSPIFIVHGRGRRPEGSAMRRSTTTGSEIRDCTREVAAGDGFTLLEVILVTAIIAVCAAMAIPRYGSAAGRHQANLAARRVAADLRQAQLCAKAISASCTVTFTVATSRYQLTSVSPLDGSSGTYTVDLTIPPYKARIVSVSFNGTAQVVFSGWGLPDNAGSVVIASGSEQRTVALNKETGEVSIQ